MTLLSQRLKPEVDVSHIPEQWPLPDFQTTDVFNIEKILNDIYVVM